MTYLDLKLEWESEQDYIVCNTSGSTGTPTKICLPKIQMIESAERTNKFFRIDKSSLLYSCISPDFIGGKMMWVRSFISNAKFLYEQPTNHPLADVETSLNIDLLSVVPSQLKYIIENQKSLPTIKTILVGGAPLSPFLKQKVVESGLNVYESYGMTETASHIALRKVRESEYPFNTLPGITVEEYDGRLKINIGSNQSYLTNDVAKIITETEFYILGRIDNVVNSGGIKINVEKLESMTSIDDDIKVAFTSIPDDKWGEALVMVVEGGIEQLETVKDRVRNILTNYLKPKFYLPIDSLPLTQNGKLNRSELKDFAIRSCAIF